MNQVTHILNALERGDSQAAEHLLPLLYQELRQMNGGQQDGPGAWQSHAAAHVKLLRITVKRRAR